MRRNVVNAKEINMWGTNYEFELVLHHPKSLIDIVYCLFETKWSIDLVDWTENKW
jgi:hypothetical protein